MDHEDAVVWGNTGEANRPLPAETNMRRGGFDGALYQQYQALIRDLQAAGKSRSQARAMAREAVQGEIDANKNSPPPRSMDPEVFAKLPTNPSEQGR